METDFVRLSMVLRQEIKRLDDNGKVLLGEFLTEVPELVPQDGSQGSSAQVILHTVNGRSQNRE